MSDHKIKICYHQVRKYYILKTKKRRSQDFRSAQHFLVHIAFAPWGERWFREKQLREWVDLWLYETVHHMFILNNKLKVVPCPRARFQGWGGGCDLFLSEDDLDTQRVQIWQQKPWEVDLCFFWVITSRAHTSVEIQAFTTTKKVASLVVPIVPMSLFPYFVQKD